MSSPISGVPRSDGSPYPPPPAKRICRRMPGAICVRDFWCGIVPSLKRISLVAPDPQNEQHL